MMYTRVVEVGLPLLLLAACNGIGNGEDGELTKSEACDMASDELESTSTTLLNGTVVDDAVAARCRNFLSKEDRGTASIEVLIEYEKQRPSGHSETVDTWVTCAFAEYDQGWQLLECYDT